MVEKKGLLHLILARPTATVIGFLFYFFGILKLWSYTDNTSEVNTILLLHFTFFAVAALCKNKSLLSLCFAVASLPLIVMAINLSNLTPVEIPYLVFNLIIASSLIFNIPWLPFLIGVVFAVSYYVSDSEGLHNITNAMGCLIMGAVFWICSLLIKTFREERNKYYLASIKDSLTDTYRFRHIVEIGQNKLDHGKEISIYLIDVDGFKEVNDTYGHATGNEVLINLADYLVEATTGIGEVGRLGGDEFIIVTEENSMQNFMPEELKKGIGSKKFHSFNAAGELEIFISIGEVSSRHYPEENMNELLHIADMNMYKIKKMNKEKLFLCNTLNSGCDEEADSHRQKISKTAQTKI